MSTYTTIQDVHAYIIEAIEGMGTDTPKAAEYNLDQIADQCFTYTAGEGFTLDDDADFWFTVTDAEFEEFTGKIAPGDDDGTANAIVFGFNGWEVANWETGMETTLEDTFSAEGYEVTRVDGEVIHLRRN